MKEAFDIVLAGLCLVGLAATGAALLARLAWRAVCDAVAGRGRPQGLSAV